MTTYVYFDPSDSANFQFNPELDGVTYVCIITWNIRGNRYYFNIYDNFGNLVLSRPLVPSPDEGDIPLLYGYFQTSTMVFRQSTQNFEINP